MNLIGSVINKSLNKQSLNILGFCTHETFQSGLANCFPQHNFYFLYQLGLKTWDNRFRKLPKNCYLLKDGKIPIDLQFNICMSQNVDQYQYLAQISRQYNIPLINITHTAVYPQFSKNYLRQVKEMRGDFNIFITDNSMKQWGWNDKEAIVIEHMIDTDEFCPDNSVPKNKYILSVCNQFNRPVRFAPCGYPIWEQIILADKQELPWAVIGADCLNGFAEPAKDLNDLINHYRKAQIFLNTSQISPIPMSMLEAGASGLPIISTSTCAIPEIFIHNETALLSNNPKELRKFCIQLLNSPEECSRLGNNAREMIKKRFSPERFRNQWQEIFQKCV